MSVRAELMKYKDEANADFQARLAPTIARETCLGVRVPDLRIIEKKYRSTSDAEEFLRDIPHEYYDENLLHSVFISNMKDYDRVMRHLDGFLPYVDNWAVCDTLRPIIFKKQKEGLLEKIKEWISSDRTYTCRFGIDMLMTYFLDEEYQPEYLEYPASVVSNEYYVNMMVSWYFATALAKQWDDAVKYLTESRLTAWIHNKTIQKARESFRFTDEQKKFLKTLKR